MDQSRCRFTISLFSSLRQYLPVRKIPFFRYAELQVWSRSTPSQHQSLEQNNSSWTLEKSTLGERRSLEAHNAARTQGTSAYFSGTSLFARRFSCWRMKTNRINRLYWNTIKELTEITYIIKRLCYDLSSRTIC